jgi:hypothetical protein
VQDGDQRAPKDEQEEAEQALVRVYVGESGAARCRRVVLDGYLDRREVERAGREEGEERCNICSGEEAERGGVTRNALMRPRIALYAVSNHLLTKISCICC